MSQFAKGPQKEAIQVEQEDGETSKIDEQQLMGCAPYLQIFKAGKLICTSAASLHVQQSEEELPFVQVMDGTIPFNINQIIQGDILIRCRHLTFGKKRVSMFRAAFHTGYAPPNVLRLTKAQLDGACSDKRYPNDFFLDLIFEKVDADAVVEPEEEKESEETKVSDVRDDIGEKGKGPVVKASNFDSMLKGDSRFWDVISSKKQEHMRKSNDDPFWGPTVGRRRGDSTKAATDEKNKTTELPAKERTHLETFSIGNELDFLPVTDKIEMKEDPPKRDSLMDALNALEEDEGRSSAIEEIIFDEPESCDETVPPVFNDMKDASIDGNEQAENNVTKEESHVESTSAAPEDIVNPSQQDESEEDKASVQHAQKRPEVVKCEIHRAKISGEDWTILVGIVDGKPF